MKVALLPIKAQYPDSLKNGLKEFDCRFLDYGLWGLDDFSNDIEMILKKELDIIHFNWPEAVTYRLPTIKDPDAHLVQVENALKKINLSKTKIVWTMHNFAPHEYKKDRYYSELYLLFSRHCDAAIHHSEWGMQACKDRFSFRGDCEHVLVRHGAFNEETCLLSKEEARKKLKLPPNKRIFLTIGGLREYKNIESLIVCAKRLPNSYFILSYAFGEESYIEKVKSLIGESANIQFQIGRVENVDLAVYAKASDSFIFAHGDENLTSGSPHLSHAYGIPQVSVKYPYAEEILGEQGIFSDSLPSLEEGLFKRLSELSDEEIEEKRHFFAELPEMYQWEFISKQTKDLYERLLS